MSRCEGRGIGAVAMVLAFGGILGCAASGDVISLTVGASQGRAAVRGGSSLTAAVTAFEDARAAKGRLGVRRHLWGGETTFAVPGDRPGPVVATVVADVLGRHGWQATVGTSNGTDLTVTGKVLSLAVEAESKMFRTDLVVKTKLQVEGRNAGDGSVVRMTVNGEGTEGVFWFEPEDAQALLQTVLTESVDKFMQQTKTENKLLRLK